MWAVARTVEGGEDSGAGSRAGHCCLMACGLRRIDIAASRLGHLVRPTASVDSSSTVVAGPVGRRRMAGSASEAWAIVVWCSRQHPCAGLSCPHRHLKFGAGGMAASLQYGWLCDSAHPEFCCCSDMSPAPGAAAAESVLVGLWLMPVSVGCRASAFPGRVRTSPPITHTPAGSPPIGISPSSHPGQPAGDASGIGVHRRSGRGRATTGGLRELNRVLITTSGHSAAGGDALPCGSSLESNMVTQQPTGAAAAERFLQWLLETRRR